MTASAPLTCLIVDDNEMNRLTLEHFVDITEGLTLAGSFENPVLALNFLRSHPATDVLLLDIEMPLLTGLELARLLPQPPPEIVFVTSHPECAVEAYDVQAIDFLLKPVQLNRFQKAVERVVARRLATRLAAAVPETYLEIAENPAGTGLGAGNPLFVKSNGQLVRVDFDDVCFIEALSTHSVLVTPDEQYTVYATLKSLVKRLPFAHFLRVHRSFIVNTRRIDSIENHVLQLGAYSVPVSKSYQAALYAALPDL